MKDDKSTITARNIERVYIFLLYNNYLKNYIDESVFMKFYKYYYCKDVIHEEAFNKKYNLSPMTLSTILIFINLTKYFSQVYNMNVIFINNVMYASQNALDIYLTGVKMIIPNNVNEVFIAKSKIDCALVDKVKTILNTKKIKKFKKEYIKNNKNTSDILEEDNNALRHDFCLIISYMFDSVYKQKMAVST
jgi:hypothetical protein